MPNSKFSKYTLIVGENTYSSPTAANEADARKLQSLIPSLSGALEREQSPIPFTVDAPFPTKVGFFHQYNRNNGIAGIVRHLFCATATVLYHYVVGTSTSWTAVSLTGGALTGFPVAQNIDNVMHLSDGLFSYIFDGTQWQYDGLQIPLVPPQIVTNVATLPTILGTNFQRINNIVTCNLVSAPNAYLVGTAVNLALLNNPQLGGTFVLSVVNTTGPTFSVSFPSVGPNINIADNTTLSTPGITILSNRYYWTTYVDETITRRQHESSSSPISIGTGTVPNPTLVKVHQRPGTVSSVDGINFNGSGTNFSAADVGLILTVGASGATGLITSVTSATTFTLGTAAPVSVPGNFYVVAPARATHWNVYASSSEEDKVGNLLATMPITIATFIDDSPMLGTPGAAFSSVQRPLLNDPPNATTRMAVHKNRIWRRDETFQNYVTYTAYEEVLAEQAGSPYECVPGHDPNTVSTQDNEISYPDQSIHVRALASHGDQLFIASEKNVLPLFGSSLADFALSQALAFAVGVAGRRTMISTPFGLAFLSYDNKLYLYPSQYEFGVDSTTALVELGRPKRDEFETILGSDYDNAHLVFYNWGRRNWLVLSYQNTSAQYRTWVFDFEAKGWFQLQAGYTAIGVFEMQQGRKSLIAATTANTVVVIDDLAGNFTPTTQLPVGYYRTLVFFEDPDAYYVIRGVNYETSDENMEVDVTMWLDPTDPNNPGIGIPLHGTETALGAFSFSARPNSDTGASCQRVLLEFAIAASSVNARFYGFTVMADKIPNPVL